MLLHLHLVKIFVPIAPKINWRLLYYIYGSLVRPFILSGNSPGRMLS